MPPKKQTSTPAPAQSQIVGSSASSGGGAVASSSKKKTVAFTNQPIVPSDSTVAPVIKEEDDVELEVEAEDEDDVFGPDEEEDVVIPEDDDVQKEDDDQKEDEDEDEEEEEDQEEEDEDGNVRRKPKKKSKKGGVPAPVIGLGAVEDVDEEPVLMDDDYIQRVHPEMILPDTKELQEIMRSYTRDENPVARKSRPILSKYEATSIVGMRAQQIIRGSTPFVESTEVNPIEIALEELRAKLIPIIVRRVMPDGVSEYWRLTELTYYE